MLFSIQKELFDRLPDLTIGVVVATGMDNSHPSPEIEQLLLQTVEELRRGFGGKGSGTSKNQTMADSFFETGHLREQVSKFH